MKTLNLAELRNRSNVWRRQGHKLVLTNGAFDLLHVGHVRYLKAARTLGDILIVGINDDAAVRRLKGQERPLNTAADRAEVVAALCSVNHVVIFSENTADELVEAVRPEIYVKGGDYSADPTSDRYPPEGSRVRRHGGDVRIIEFVPERSTSALVARLRATIS